MYFEGVGYTGSDVDSDSDSEIKGSFSGSGRFIVLCFRAKHLAISVSLHPGYKWAPVKCWRREGWVRAIYTVPCEREFTR